jgi:hypothetical protein
MLKRIFFILLTFISVSASAQIQVSKLLGANSDKFTTGYGGFLKYAYPISNSSDVSLEIGFMSFSLKADNAYGWIIIPVKAGYRYTLNQTGYGFYLEPYLGYNFAGIDPDDKKFKGMVYGAGTGYLFKPTGKVNFDLGIQYESAQHTGGAANYLSFRLTHNFGGSRRQNDE